MNKLKIVAAGWENYTGYLGMVDFTDGISVEKVSKLMASRVTSTVAMVEVDDEGQEHPTGVAHDLILSGAIVGAPEVLALATEEELKAERLAMKKSAKKDKIDKFYQLEELQVIADTSGLKGLREIGLIWEVRERSIPGLIEQIMIAQRDYQETLNAKKYEERHVVITGNEPEPVYVTILQTELEIKAMEAIGPEIPDDAMTSTVAMVEVDAALPGEALTQVDLMDAEKQPTEDDLQGMKFTETDGEIKTTEVSE